MSTKIKIPKGWRQMEHPMTIRKGDKYLWYGKWEHFFFSVGDKTKSGDRSTVIRRIPKKRKKT